MPSGPYRARPPPAPQSCPNPEDPLNNQVAELWKADEDRAIANAKEWTRLYATK